jgi:hypothetical protein
MMEDGKRQLLRHLVATVAFRGRVAVDGAPPGFADLRITPDTRTPGEILAHIGDLLIGSHLLLRGDFVELASAPLAWDEEK